MGCIFAFLFAAVAASAQTSDSLLIPSDPGVAGWSVSGPQERYDTASLYQYLDGGADIVIEFGFDDLSFQRYTKQDQEIDLELYRMAGPEAALGLYFYKAGEERPSAELGARNSLSNSQLLFVKGDFVAVLTSLQGDSAGAQIACSIARKLIANLPKEEQAPLLDRLPKIDLISGSTRIVHGPLSTPPAFSAVRSLIAQLCSDNYGISADYHIGKGKTEHRLFIPFADSSAARTVFDSVKSSAAASSLQSGPPSQFTLPGNDSQSVQVFLNKKTVEITAR